MAALAVSEVDKMFPHAASLAILVWVALLASVYSSVPSQSFEELQGFEQLVPALAGVLLIAVLGMYCVPFLRIIWEWKKRPSGIIFASILVIVCAIVTNLLLAFSPTPVMVDPVTGARVFLVRWCEWVPLSGLLTFMSDAIDVVPKGRNGLWKASCEHSALQAFSTLCGLIFPFCSNRLVWGAVMVLSVITYLPIFSRVEMKRQKLNETPEGVTFAERELRDRRYAAHQLLRMCSIVWTVLVAFYFLNWFMHQTLVEGHGLRHPALAMFFDTTFDVLAKGVYLKVVVEVHHNVFDIEDRIKQQFDDLRSLMNLIWDASTDVIFVSVKAKKKASTLISPAFPALVGSAPPVGVLESKNTYGVMVETDTDGVSLGESPFGEQPMKAVHANYVDSTHIASASSSAAVLVAPIDLGSPLVEVATDIINALWDRLANNLKEKASVLLLHEFNRPDGQACHCEIKVSRRSTDSLVAIVRDVTERAKRFSAEQKAHEEAIARQRDAQAINRFTRHEIKNGLLSGLELCRRLQIAFDQVGETVENCMADVPDHESRLVESGMNKTSGMIGQIDRVFHDVLDTVLAEAVARDVVHECYQPFPKKVNLEETLRATGIGVGVHEKFPLKFPVGGIPHLMLDEVMLRYIHRNAISNASKYGRPGGKIATHVDFDDHNWLLQVKVENEPGVGHDRLVAMGETASQMVFQQGSRLHHQSGEKELSNGAWVMQKCATNMGGICAIKFEKDKTVFSFECPASPCEDLGLGTPAAFEMPANVWGLGIDDSPIQRKVLLRLMADCGIAKSRRKVLGRHPEEIQQMGQTISLLLDHEANSKVVAFVDENLDFDVEGKRVLISGSTEMERILKELPPDKQERLLIIVRSADDTLDDVAVYFKRAHGFLPKSVADGEGVMDHLAPLWLARFGPPGSPETTMTGSGGGSSFGGDILTKEDLSISLSSVEELLRRKTFREIPWDHLWSALHSMKGDILISKNEHLVWATNAINALRGLQAPDNFMEKWSAIRDAVTRAMDEDL